MTRLTHLRLAAPCSLLVFFTVLSLALCPASAQAQRRYFPATYRLSNITEATDTVTLTLSLTIFNFSGGDIHNGGVVLYSSDGPRSKPVDAFNLIKLFPSDKDVTVSAEFTVPKAEYERWSRGENPNLQFLMPDGSGGTRTVPIDARPAMAAALPAK